MTTIAIIFAGLVALIQFYILILEMFLWTKPAGRRAFGFTPEFAESTRVLGANQGLYNGFLAAGIVWGLCSHSQGGFLLLIFSLSCVLLAGIYGGFTASRKILWIQALPALIALVLLHFPKH